MWKGVTENGRGGGEEERVKGQKKLEVRRKGKGEEKKKEKREGRVR